MGDDLGAVCEGGVWGVAEAQREACVKERRSRHSEESVSIAAGGGRRVSRGVGACALSAATTLLSHAHARLGTHTSMPSVPVAADGRGGLRIGVRVRVALALFPVSFSFAHRFWSARSRSRARTTPSSTRPSSRPCRQWPGHRRNRRPGGRPGGRRRCGACKKTGTEGVCLREQERMSMAARGRPLSSRSHFVLFDCRKGARARWGGGAGQPPLPPSLPLSLSCLPNARPPERTRARSRRPGTTTAAAARTPPRPHSAPAAAGQRPRRSRPPPPSSLSACRHVPPAHPRPRPPGLRLPPWPAWPRPRPRSREAGQEGAEGANRHHPTAPGGRRRRRRRRPGRPPPPSRLVGGTCGGGHPSPPPPPPPTGRRDSMRR